MGVHIHCIGSILKNHSHVFYFSTGNKINQCFNVTRAFKIFISLFAVRPKETTEEGAVGGEKDPSTSQLEGTCKKCVIIYTRVFT